MRVFDVLLFFAGLVGVCVGFLPPYHPSTTDTASTTLQMGLFDGFIKSMEEGYAGGENSEYAKRKQLDEAKRAAQRQKAEERKRKGFVELKDYNPETQKTFAKMKYDQEEKEDAVNKWAKGSKGVGFKFPWQD